MDQFRTITYCLVPEALADALITPLRRHYAGRPDVTVIVDRRRRSGHAGKDRRRPVVPRRLVAELPPELEQYAGDLRWEQRLRSVRRRLQDADLDALLELVVARDDDAQAELYWRFGGRVRTRLASLRVEETQLDAGTRQAFGRLFDRIAGGGIGSRSFDALVTRVADAVATERAASR